MNPLDLICSDRDPRARSCSPGDRTLISPNSAFGRVVRDSSALAADTHPERVLISDRALVFSVDLVTGQRVVLTGFY